MWWTMALTANDLDAMMVVAVGQMVLIRRCGRATCAPASAPLLETM
jgi:hypothetical protein